MSSEPSWQGVSSKTAKRGFPQGFVSRELLSFNRWDQSPFTKQISDWIFLPGRYCRSVGIFCRVRRWLCGRMTRGKWDDSLESRWLGRNSEVCRRQSALVQPQGRCALETWNAKKISDRKTMRMIRDTGLILNKPRKRLRPLCSKASILWQRLAIMIGQWKLF